MRLGILGLGGRWPRFRDAVRVLRGEVRVVAVWDDVPARAAREAEALGCRAAGGAVEVIESDEVEALLLPGATWAGLWPLERAARGGKPVLCAVSPLVEEERFDALCDRLGGALVEWTLWPALEVLGEAVAQRMEEAPGPAALVRASWTRPGEAIDVLRAPAALALLATGRGLIGGDAIAVTATRSAPGLASVVLEAEGGVMHLSLFAGPAGTASCRLEVEGENGGLRAALPRRLSWSGAEGRHALRLPAVPAELLVLDRFAQAVREGALDGASVVRARRALSWLRAARQSAAGGGRVTLPAAAASG